MAKERWTLRKYGIYDNYTVQIEPTMKGSWWWHDHAHYAEELLKTVEKIIDEEPDKGIFLKDLMEKVSMPPPLSKTSLRVFLRTYPDRIHMYLDTSAELGTIWLRRVKEPVDLPVFYPFPHSLGYTKQFEPDPFDWDAYKDVDDKYDVSQWEDLIDEEDLEPLCHEENNAAPGEAEGSSSRKIAMGETEEDKEEDNEDEDDEEEEDEEEEEEESAEEKSTKIK